MVLRPAFAALLVLISTASPPGEAVAMSAPDSTQLRSLDTVCRHASPLRLHTESAAFVLEACRARAEGIRGIARGGPRSSLSAPRDSVRLVRWADLERIDRGRSNVGEMALYGALIGSALGYLVSTGKPKPGDWIDPRDLRPALVGIFGGLGALFGSAAGSSRHVWEPFEPTGARDLSVTARRE